VLTRPRTPILDLEKPLPKPAAESWLLKGTSVFLLLLLIVATLKDLALIVLVFFVMGFVLLVWLATLIHELGHFVAGLLVGLRFDCINIGPFIYERKVPTRKFRIRPTLFTGFTEMSLDKVRRVRKRLIVFSLGGPCASCSQRSW
jgi:hypothetical protein